MSIKEDGYVAHQPKVITREPGGSSKSLPSGWNKESGYQSIVGQLSDMPSDSILEVSVVFDNSNRIKPWTKAPYGRIVDYLMQERKGEFYGLSDLENDIVWWTQEITLDQATDLYNETVVINLVPRI